MGRNPQTVEVLIPYDCDADAAKEAEEEGLHVCAAVWGPGKTVSIERNVTTSQHSWPNWTHKRITFTKVDAATTQPQK